MKRQLLTMAILPVLVIVWFGSTCFANIETKSLQGTIVAVHPDQITVQKESVIFPEKIKFKISDATKYKTIKSTKDLSEGNKVQVEYYEENGERIASLITSLESSPTNNKGG